MAGKNSFTILGRMGSMGKALSYVRLADPSYSVPDSSCPFSSPSLIRTSPPANLLGHSTGISYQAFRPDGRVPDPTPASS